MNLSFRSQQALKGARQYLDSTRGHADCVCAECRFADMFAVQPRALCKHPVGPQRGEVLFASAHACIAFQAPPGVDLRMARYAMLEVPDQLAAGFAAEVMHAA
jgi:hypothetical protein